MPRFRQIEQIQQLMGKKEAIRNMGIIAHIDHGKTTLADSLLAGAGLLSSAMAGTARVLDYLEEEQKRKITIKTANISLLYKTAAVPFIINLVDTPGHVDFTGKVTRALRAIDGAVVVVDAVEEIMAQTEIVTRQALEERVRPVLFINKVDRLITELQLNAEQIQKKLDSLISRFNDLIEVYGEAPYKDQWKISPVAGNVAFGAALHGWGFTLDIAKQKGAKFQDIINAYQKREQNKLQKALPVHKAVFEMAIRCMPSPREAQAYRVERIWDGHVDSAVGRALAECSDDGPTVICVTNVQATPDGGCVAAGRVFSGKVKKGDNLHLVDALCEATVDAVSVDMGSFREEVDDVSAGNLAAITLPVMLKAGETLVDSAHKTGMVPFESITYVSEPVVTIAVEPKNPKDIPALLEALDKLIPQTEAYLEVLSIGPLHHDDIYQLFFDPIKNETVYINKHPNFLQRYLNYSIDRINVANYRAVSNINALGETYFNVTVHNNNTFPVNSVTLFGQIPSRGSNILDWHALFDDVLQPNETYVFPVGIKELPTNTFATGYLTQISNSSNKP